MPFGLGIDIDDAAIGFQWCITPTVNFNDLQQRIGRVVRSNGEISLAVVFVQPALLNSLPEDWQEGFSEFDPTGRGVSDVERCKGNAKLLKSTESMSIRPKDFDLRVIALRTRQPYT